MAKKKRPRRKKKEKSVSEFRKERTKQAKGHARYLFAKIGKKYLGLKLTHGQSVDGVMGLTLINNPEPNPKDKRPVNIIPKIEKFDEDDLSKRLPWSFSGIDAQMVKSLIEQLRKEKKQ